ncbi:DHYS-like protein [Mya arenaria]|uniref:DHYS-like protein n=1 Tax=Mya arenaria TaxID=6604 RepID=A0ABY7G7X6_MYAAR|nr:DHYS-like protein [Mya arenaria]
MRAVIAATSLSFMKIRKSCEGGWGMGGGSSGRRADTGRVWSSTTRPANNKFLATLDIVKKPLEFSSSFGIHKLLPDTCINTPIADENVKEWAGHPTGRVGSNCTIFLSYTSNLISAGVRETIRYLVQNNMGINRIGNLLVPNDNYCKFEDWLIPILDTMLQEQNDKGTLWTPSRMIDRLGREINHPDSVYYWAHKNNIPVFCPALTDGSLGDMLYFHSYKNPGLICAEATLILPLLVAETFARRQKEFTSPTPRAETKDTG